MKEKNVSLVFNLYQPNLNLLERILKALENQKSDYYIEFIVVNKKMNDESIEFVNRFKKKSKKMIIKVIKVDENLSFASSMNIGLKAAKQEIVVVLQQDCVPSNELWLSNLIKPFDDEEVVATVSKVQFPEELWNRLDSRAQAIMLQEKGTITPLLDEKGCAYRLSVFKKLGLFNDRDFRTAGEDFDLYIKLKKEGKIIYPDSTILHFHPTDFKTRLEKITQYANGFGTLVRMHGNKMPRWYVGFLKAIPIIGLPAFIISYPFNKGFSLYPHYLALTPMLHFNYIKGFWKGFLSGSQSVDVFKKN
ncbi:glycosyltransferase family 2 protein [Candidatus Pacearchaeota archaeon]|nr:glycosyltransferase family 2 protein [Candidatus Pacearchaeota archaeon]